MFDYETQNAIVDTVICVTTFPLSQPKSGSDALSLCQVSPHTVTDSHVEIETIFRRIRSHNNGSHVNEVHLKFVECHEPDAFYEWNMEERLKMDYKGDCINHIGCHCVCVYYIGMMVPKCQVETQYSIDRLNERVERVDEFNGFMCGLCNRMQYNAMASNTNDATNPMLIH